MIGDDFKMTYGFDDDLNKVQVLESDRIIKATVPVTRANAGGFDIQLSAEEVYNLLGCSVADVVPMMVEYKLDQYTYITATEPQAYCTVARGVMTNQLRLGGTCPQANFDIVITFLRTSSI